MNFVRLINSEELGLLLPYDALIPALREAMIGVSEGSYAMPLRHAIQLEGTGRLGVMTGSDRRSHAATVKLVAFPAAPGTESHAGLVALFNGAEMRLSALLPSHALTARRTAAATAVATDALANASARTLAILGTGAQAAAHLEALVHVRDFDRIRIWGRSRDHALKLAAQCPAAMPVDTIEEAVADADVVCTVTASTSPILRGSTLCAGAHVNLVGASFPDAREADDATLGRGTLFVDSRESAAAQAGELRGAFGISHIKAEIGEVLAGSSGRVDQQEITIYKSLGVAAQDLVAAEIAIARAEAAGCGELIAI